MRILSITDHAPSQVYQEQVLGISRVLSAEVLQVTQAELNPDTMPDRTALAIQKVIAGGEFVAVLAPQTPHWLRVLSIFGASCGIPFISGLVTRHLPDCERVICANRLIEKLCAPSSPFCATLVQSETARDSGVWTVSGTIRPVSEIHVAEVKSFTAFESELMSLESARIVFAGGLGLGSKAAFEKLRQCAKKYNAGLAASRLAVDLGWCGNEIQVGQTGRSVAPEIYVAFGISGAVQHLAGIQNAGRIIAINTDRDAPIFSFAHQGIIADANRIIDMML